MIEELLAQSLLNLGFGGVAFYLMYRFAVHTVEQLRTAVERNTEVLVRLDVRLSERASA